jgi:hypothetical protein
LVLALLLMLGLELGRDGANSPYIYNCIPLIATSRFGDGEQEPLQRRGAGKPLGHSSAATFHQLPAAGHHYATGRKQGHQLVTASITTQAAGRFLNQTSVPQPLGTAQHLLPQRQQDGVQCGSRLGNNPAGTNCSSCHDVAPNTKHLGKHAATRYRYRFLRQVSSNHLNSRLLTPPASGIAVLIKFVGAEQRRSASQEVLQSLPQRRLNPKMSSGCRDHPTARLSWYLLVWTLFFSSTPSTEQRGTGH